MSYRKGEWRCDGAGCHETRRTLPPEWYCAQVAGALKTFCTGCLDRLHRRLLRGQGRAV